MTIDQKISRLDNKIDQLVTQRAALLRQRTRQRAITVGQLVTALLTVDQSAPIFTVHNSDTFSPVHSLEELGVFYSKHTVELAFVDDYSDTPTGFTVVGAD